MRDRSAWRSNNHGLKHPGRAPGKRAGPRANIRADGMPQVTGAERLNVWIVHPADADGQVLVSTLRRAGAQPEYA